MQDTPALHARGAPMHATNVKVSMQTAIMYRLSTLLLGMALCGVSAAQTVYKWVDEKGGVHYGEKPPANVRAKPVDTQPYGVEAGEGECHTIICQGQKADADKRRQAEQDARDARARAAAPPSPPATRGMEFDAYIRLQRGMSEGELLLRAGPPDYEALDNSLFGGVKKSFYYYPTPANPYTTIVTIRGGRIADLERIRKF